jgi:hypothetical protein
LLGDEGRNQSLSIPEPTVIAGPTSLKWFADADLNGDGDISRLEFNGTTEQFLQLDTNHDNFISRDEAEHLSLQ